MTIKQKNITTVILVLFVALLDATYQAIAQQPPKPAEFKLNLEASKDFIDIGNQEQDIVRRANEALGQLATQKQKLLIASGVPRADLTKVDCRADGPIIVCVKPEQAKANPEKK